MRKLIMILCLAVMAMFLVSCAGQATTMLKLDCEQKIQKTQLKCDEKSADFKKEITMLNQKIKTSNEQLTGMQKLTEQLTADKKILEEQLKIAKQTIALAQTTGSAAPVTYPTCPTCAASIATAPVTAAPSSGCPALTTSGLYSGQWAYNPSIHQGSWANLAIIPEEPVQPPKESNTIGYWAYVFPKTPGTDGHWVWVPT